MMLYGLKSSWDRIRGVREQDKPILRSCVMREQCGVNASHFLIS